MTPKLTLVSFDLCPYVQRAAIVLAEKKAGFERRTIDLANKPDWFISISPMGKVPLLLVNDDVLFESAVIVDYLDETIVPRLHPEDPLKRARHRALVEFGSSILADVWVVETAKDVALFDKAVQSIGNKFARMEAELGAGPFYAGPDFCVVDAVFAPIFRYFDVFDRLTDLGVFHDKPKMQDWRAALAERPSVRDAVVADYEKRLETFLRDKDGHLMQIADAA